MSLPSTLRIAGIDPSMSNFGFAFADYTPGTGELVMKDLALVKPEKIREKSVRKNSRDLSCASILAREAMRLLKEVNVVFAEMPSGSQSARAMASYGICIGVLGALRASGHELIELTPTEVKLALCEDPKATKEAMIAQAVLRYPALPWPVHRASITVSRAEHLADAIGAIEAGIQSPDFLRLEALYRQVA